ncbi:MAG TPA: alpha/beta fold hydrolase [Acidimicrobiales bacterium]|nr:alpha/beta fold hydrolase [Acidimicrobiales bacterium]
MPATWSEIPGPAGPLALHSASTSPAPLRPGVVVLCHGFPSGLASADHAGDGIASLADRLAAESGRRTMTACFRGVGASAGDFSLQGWMDDLRAIVDHGAAIADGGGVWLVGFGAGGALALCAASDDGRVHGVACLGAPASFTSWSRHATEVIDNARHAGIIRTDGFPPDVRAWSAAFAALHPEAAAAQIPPRALLVVHGSDDDEVPVSEARALVEAAGDGAELRVVLGAGNRLLADPRAVALLAGWLERQPSGRA